MEIGKMIKKLRISSGMSQDAFAERFSVSRQSVQKWESGVSIPSIEKIIEIAKCFDVSLDALILNNDNRHTLEKKQEEIKPQYANIHDWEFYASDILIEYEQSIEEGLDVSAYKGLFEAVSRLPKNEAKKKLGDVLFEIVSSAKQVDGYKYIEPSDLEGIKALRKEYSVGGKVSKKRLESKIHGAWVGRICGCMLGRTVECIRTNELIPLLKETGNYPMHRYIYRSDITDEMCAKYNYPLASRDYADQIDGMVADDDTNYVVMAQSVIEKYGKDFTPYNVATSWLELQGKDAYCTAERVAYCNFIKGYQPPQSAMFQNPYREWIGAQIRGDYFGYINPGNPALASEMAWRDASISHVKNGIYGEMLVSAMIATAGVTDNVKDIILCGLGQIPTTSRLYEEINNVLSWFESGIPQNECFEKIHSKYNEYTGHGWCHTIPNAMIVVAALLYGGGDYGKSICMAVETGFDTDCNGATVGSIVGMMKGIDGIPEYWQKPINNTLNTTIFGIGSVKITDRVKLTMKHIML